MLRTDHFEPGAGISMHAGPSIHFGTGSKPDSLRMHFRIPLATLSQPLTGLGTVADGGLQMSGTIAPGIANSSVSGIGVIGLSPSRLIGCIPATSTTRSDYAFVPDSTFMLILTSCFSRYRLCSPMKLSYMPTSTVNTTIAFALAVTDDVYSPTLGLASFQNATANTPVGPTFNTVKNSADAMVFAAWAPWVKSFTVDQRSEYYLSASINGTLGTHAYNVAPFTDELRLNFFGALSCYCNSDSTTPVTGIGELYWEQTIELLDFTPISTGVTIPYTLSSLVRSLELPTLPSLSSLKALPLRELKSVSKKDDDDYSEPPDPPPDRRDPPPSPNAINLIANPPPRRPIGKSPGPLDRR
jgi:hypothetical protein